MQRIIENKAGRPSEIDPVIEELEKEPETVVEVPIEAPEMVVVTMLAPDKVEIPVTPRDDLSVVAP